MSKKISKADINFLESQKIGAKETKSNFEAILVAAAVLGIGVMGYFYFSINSQVQDLKSKRDELKSAINIGNETLDNLKSDIQSYEQMIAGINAQIEAYKSANAAAGTATNLTEAHIKAIYMEAYYAGMTVESMSYTGNTLSFTVKTTDRTSAIVRFNDSLTSSEVSATGYINAKMFILNETAWQVPADKDLYEFSYSVTILPINITDGGVATASAEGGNE